MLRRLRYLSSVVAFPAVWCAADLHADKPVITRLGAIDCDTGKCGLRGERISGRDLEWLPSCFQISLISQHISVYSQ